MYSKSLNLDDNITDNQKYFIKALSEMLELFKFPLIDMDEVKVTKEDKDLIVSLPHKIEKDIDYSIAMNDKEVIIFFANTHHHFDQFGDGDDWINKAVSFISLMMQGKIEVHIFYRNDKIIKEIIYQVKDNEEKELISSSVNLNTAFFNPFIKARREIKMISDY